MKPHEYYMELALEEAGKAGENEEVPIGAVLVDADGDILVSAQNSVITNLDPTAHSEILCIRQAASKIGNYRLLNTTLYVTVEPCVMCMGAIIHARLETVVFGTPDIRWGAAGSLYNMADDNRLNHHIHVVSGVKKDECRRLIQNFFKTRRGKSG